MDEIVFEQYGPLAVATLNRPAALNAQNINMIRAFYAQLTVWEADPAITRLLIRGAGDRALCAGGDVRELWTHAFPQQTEFFDTEYHLCQRLAQTSLQTIAYMDGLTMGGGVGLSINANFRLATPRTVWAMPESQIGFFPDIAASYFLPRLAIAGVPAPQLGRMLGLTGTRLNGADCMAVGIATHHVESGQGEVIMQALATADDIETALMPFSLPAGDAPILPIAAHLPVSASLPDFLVQLRDMNLLPPNASALSLHVIDAMLAIGARLSYDAAVAMDGRMVRHFLRGETFREGVRARLVDKDNAPRWDMAWENYLQQAKDSMGGPVNILNYFA